MTMLNMLTLSSTLAACLQTAWDRQALPWLHPVTKVAIWNDFTKTLSGMGIGLSYASPHTQSETTMSIHAGQRRRQISTGVKESVSHQKYAHTHSPQFWPRLSRMMHRIPVTGNDIENHILCVRTLQSWNKSKNQNLLCSKTTICMN